MERLKNYRQLTDIRNDIPLHHSHINVSSGRSASSSLQKSKILLHWKSIRNWDQLFTRAYEYYIGKGFFTIILSKALNLLTVAFVLSFGTFLVGCIDHQNISKVHHLSEAIIPQCLSKLHYVHVIALFIFTGYWIFEACKLITDIPKLHQMNLIYSELLHIEDSELYAINWNSIVEKFVQLYGETISSGLAHSNRLTASDIVSMIMRKENYLIALFNKDILDLRPPIPSVLSFGFGGKQILTKVLELNLSYCIMDYVFESQSEQGKDRISVRKEFLKNTKRKKLISGLKRRFIVMGIINLLLSPFISLFMVVYFLFLHGQEFQKDPAKLSARSYSLVARWKFRDFNELSHAFEDRLKLSYPTAEKYVSQYQKEYVAVIARFISFIAGSIALSLTALSVLDDDILLNFYITDGRTVIWYLGLFGVIWSTTRGLIPDSRTIFEPEKLLNEIVSIIHYLPLEWKSYGLHSERVHQEFSKLYDLNVILTIQELLSVVITPFVLIFTLPSCAPAVIDFFREFTVHVDGIGHVCTFSVFDFRQFNEGRGKVSAFHKVRAHVDMEEKLEQSVINFKTNYPEWQQRDVEEHEGSRMDDNDDDDSGREEDTSDIRHELDSAYLKAGKKDQYSPPFIHNEEELTKYAPPFIPTNSSSQYSEDQHQGIELSTRNTAIDPPFVGKDY